VSSKKKASNKLSIKKKEITKPKAEKKVLSKKSVEKTGTKTNNKTEKEAKKKVPVKQPTTTKKTETKKSVPVKQVKVIYIFLMISGTNLAFLLQLSQPKKTYTPWFTKCKPSLMFACTQCFNLQWLCCIVLMKFVHCI
jgi:hypothetical protein